MVSSLGRGFLQRTKTFTCFLGRWSMWPTFAAGQTVLRNHKPCCTPKERQAQSVLLVKSPELLEETTMMLGYPTSFHHNREQIVVSD
uniref:Uncharacterized protein n=1 Tax=Melopsittacus undulatus TaxID=13146 RepID=A0A8V5H867_MELUD